MSSFDHDTLTEYLLGLTSPQLTRDIESALKRQDASLLGALAQAEAMLADVWLAECEPVQPSNAMRERLFASLEPEAGFMGFAHMISELVEEPLESARAYLESLLDPEAWFPGLTPTSWIVHVEGGINRKKAVVGFIKVDPGGEFPHHKHAGEELMFILQGVILDGEKRYERGQLIVQAPDTEHDLRVAEDGEPAIFLTVADRGIYFGEIFFGPDAPEL